MFCGVHCENTLTLKLMTIWTGYVHQMKIAPKIACIDKFKWFAAYISVYRFGNLRNLLMPFLFLPHMLKIPVGKNELYTVNNLLSL